MCGSRVTMIGGLKEGTVSRPSGIRRRGSTRTARSARLPGVRHRSARSRGIAACGGQPANRHALRTTQVSAEVQMASAPPPPGAGRSRVLGAAIMVLPLGDACVGGRDAPLFEQRVGFSDADKRHHAAGARCAPSLSCAYGQPFHALRAAPRCSATGCISRVAYNGLNVRTCFGMNAMKRFDDDDFYRTHDPALDLISTRGTLAQWRSHGKRPLLLGRQPSRVSGRRSEEIARQRQASRAGRGVQRFVSLS